MTTYQAADRWSEQDSTRSLIPSYSPIDYSPAPLGKTGSTGIRESLAENLFTFTSSGSGSWYDAVFSQLKSYVTRDHLPGDWSVITLAFGETPEKVSPSTIAEKLDEIRDAFGLSMAALADILRASRASVYNWFENEPRSAEIIQRIEALYGIAHEWKTKNPYHYAPGRLMKQKLGDDPSMYERLSREELDMDEIHSGMDSLLVLMDKQRERMDRAKARSAKVPADAEGHRELLERLTGSVSADK